MGWRILGIGEWGIDMSKCETWRIWKTGRGMK
jgi:hypothetical protein